MIKVRNLSVYYGSFAALKNVSLDVKAGECLLVTGPSGCGKSSLVRVLTGLIPHAIPARVEGSVEIAGMTPLTCTIPEIAQKVGVVYQNPAAQLFHLNVADEVAFGPRNLDLSEAEIAGRVEWALEATGLSELRQAQPANLSGGQKQRLAIAAALAMHPQALVLDEPAASLDVPGTQAIVQTLKQLQHHYGLTIVLIEHRLAEVSRLVDRVIVMEQGQVVIDDDPDQVWRDRSLLRQLGLRRPVDQPIDNWDSLLKPNPRPPNGTRPLLELSQVSAGYGSKTVLDKMDLSLFPGEYVALVGQNGAGKSTLGLAAAGLLKPSGGKVIFAGGKKPRPGLDVSLLFQNPADQLLTDTVEEEVAFGPKNYGVLDSDYQACLLAQADLLELIARSPTTLSAGQQQRTAAAACLSLRPRLLILDEPTLGQD
jgi:energy-coupling factor transport system ATP-binding protein